jgi:hypothetical protein
VPVERVVEKVVTKEVPVEVPVERVVYQVRALATAAEFAEPKIKHVRSSLG